MTDWLRGQVDGRQVFQQTPAASGPVDLRVAESLRDSKPIVDRRETRKWRRDFIGFASRSDAATFKSTAPKATGVAYIKTPCFLAWDLIHRAARGRRGLLQMAEVLPV